jgi:multicomponent Na+:H+ antiporter subunit G
VTAWAVALLVLLGTSLVLVASLGVLRLPDLYTRMHASTKPATLGVSVIVAALAIHSGDLGIAMRAVLIVLFFLLTAPVAAHRLGRAAYRAGVPCGPGTVRDDLARAGGDDAPPSDSSGTIES